MIIPMVNIMKSQVFSVLCIMGATLAFNVTTSTTASAEIFKCTNKAGKVYYNDKPCPMNQKEKKIQASKDPVNGYIPKTQPVAPLVGKDASKNKKDDFGTPQYKGKESKTQHDSRVKYEAQMEKRAEVEKEARNELELQITELKSVGETEKAELLTRVLEDLQ